MRYEDGILTIVTNLTTYMTSYGLKLRPEYTEEIEEVIGNNISPLNVGALLVTSDDQIMAGVRPPGLSAGSIVGIKVYREIDSQVDGLEPHVIEEPTLLGHTRESVEWTPMLTFLLKTAHTSQSLIPVIEAVGKYEVERVRTIPAEPTQLAEYLVSNYAHALGYEGHNVPLFTTQGLLYLKFFDRLSGTSLFYETLEKISKVAGEHDTQVKVREFSPDNNPYVGLLNEPNPSRLAFDYLTF